MDWDEARQPAKEEIVVGQSLERMSVDELKALVAVLQGEINRVESEIARKRSIGDAAAAVFKS